MGCAARMTTGSGDELSSDNLEHFAKRGLLLSRSGRRLIERSGNRQELTYPPGETFSIGDYGQADASRCVVFRSAKEGPFAERKATLSRARAGSWVRFDLPLASRARCLDQSRSSDRLLASVSDPIRRCHRTIWRGLSTSHIRSLASFMMRFLSFSCSAFCRNCGSCRISSWAATCSASEGASGGGTTGARSEGADCGLGTCTANDPKELRNIREDTVMSGIRCIFNPVLGELPDLCGPGV
jgi:hypothetical protein